MDFSEWIAPKRRTRKRPARRRLCLEPLESRQLLAAQPIITEFMATNEQTLWDGDGNTSDWIEIYNAGDETADLAGWHLTDRPEDLTRWTFPSVELHAGAYLIVFASGQASDDYIDPAGYLHTNFSLDADGEYLALVRPDGETIVSQFGTAETPYDEQKTDISYGLWDQADTDLLVDEYVSSSATSIDVPNGSFESPVTSTYTGTISPWSKSGSAGVFNNNAGYGNPITNIDGNQLAYLNTTVGTMLYQEISTPYTVGHSYELTLGIAARSDRPSPGAQMQIRFFYRNDPYNPSSTAYIIGSTTVSYDLLSNTSLTDFTVTLPAVQATDAWAGKPIGIWLVSTVEGTRNGDWSLDHLRLETTGGGSTVGGELTYLVPTDGSLGDSWTGGNEPFDDSAWTGGGLHVGFDRGENIPALELLGHWPLDGNADSTAAGGLDGTLAGGTYSTDVPVPPESTQSISLSGTGQFARVDETAAIDFEWDQPFSASAWIKSDVADQDSTIVGKMEQGGNYRGWELHVGSTAGNGKLNVWIINAWPAQTIELNGTIDVLDGQWHQVAMTYAGGGDASGVKLYVDGALDTAATVGKNSLGGGSIENDIDLNFGSRQNGANHNYTGLIDDVALWSGIVSADQFAAMYVGDPPPTTNGSTDTIDYRPWITTDLGDWMYQTAGSIYLRIPFQIDDPSQVDRLVLQTRFDDGLVAYINGEPVVWLNAPATLAYDSTATAAHRADHLDDLWIDTAALAATPGALRAGENILAVQLLNADAMDEDLLLTARLWAYRNLQSREAFFPVPTPGGLNDTGVIGFVHDTKFSVDRGLFYEPFTVQITTSTEGAEIYYTTDGSLPQPGDAASMFYQGPITIDTTTVLRAAAFKTDHQPTNADTQTYIFPVDVLGQTNVQPSYATWDTEMDPNITGTLADDIAAGLAQLPTVSLVLPDADIFGAGGIYTNPGSRGEAWERAASVEYFDPVNSDQFQIDAGLRIQGGASRSTADPKHGFRLLFKEQYGATKLEYPLFEDSTVEQFDQLVLRCGLGDVWTIHWSLNLRDHATYFNDQWARESLLAMGSLASQGEFVHLYINGLFWGLYNLVERPDNSFSAEYRGGDKEDYDVIHDNTVQNGDRIEWDAMMSLAAAGLTDPANYEAICELLDVEQFADYMIMNLYAGNWDWPEHNWWAARNDADPDSKFLFYAWDTEQILENQYIPDFKGGVGTVDMNSNTVQYMTNYNTPGYLYTQLRQNTDFQRLFADRVQKHLFGDGALTAQASAERFTALRDELMLPITAESARWGDAQVEPALTRDDNWLPDVNLTISDYFPQRTAIVIQQFRDLGLYPAIDAPTFTVNGLEQFGGPASAGDVLEIVPPSAECQVYFTLDGTDPRGADDLPAGTLYDLPISIEGPITIQARTLQDGVWSALSETVFTVFPPMPGDLTVTEIHYHPAPPTTEEQAAGFTDADDFEYIEITNVSDGPVYLGELAFDAGAPAEFDFSRGAVTLLEPGQAVLVVQNVDAFLMRYGGEHADRIAGAFTDGKLSNSGEAIRLIDTDGRILVSLTYNDRAPWPTEADGGGASLVLTDPLSPGDLNDPLRWHASVTAGGTPGVAFENNLAARELYDAVRGETIPGKRPLLPGQTASWTYYSNGSAGIDGVTIDFADLPGEDPTADDFLFSTGNDDEPVVWNAVSTAAQIIVQRDTGPAGTDRVVLTWPAGAIQNTWLRITVLAGDRTGLTQDDIFYFGNFIGDVGDAGSPGYVTAADLIAIRNHPHGSNNPAASGDRYDINRDRLVDATDLILARNHVGSPLEALRMISPPLPVPVPAPIGAEGGPMVPVDWFDPEGEPVKRTSGTELSLLIDLVLGEG